MKITATKLIICSPDRNFVTLRIDTNEGIYGLGDATLNGRELAVASYLQDHILPCLIGRDPFQTEDICQYLYRVAYWRRGPVTMSAIASVDVALWDIKCNALIASTSRLTPSDAARCARALDPYPLFWIEAPCTAELQESFELIRRHTTTPLAVGEVFNSIWDAHDLIRHQLIDYIRMTIVHGGGITHAKKTADFAALYNVRTGYHGPTDVSPITMAAALHLGLAIHNFGIQEHMHHSKLTDEVFPHHYTFNAGYMHPGNAPGLGVDID